MKMLRNITVLLLVTNVVWPGLTAAQVPASTRVQVPSLTDWKNGIVLGDIQGTASYHSIAVPKGKIEDGDLIQSIKTDSGFLHSKWQADIGKSQIPEAYIDQLKEDQELLNRASNPDIPEAQKTSILRAVAEDLSIKSAHSKASPNRWATLVHVEVNTIKNGSIVSSHEIWFVPKGWADLANRWVRCGNLSSPAKADLPPGAYMMRADNGAMVPLRIGGDGKDQATIELQVP
jgi:hypothetical protein